MQFLEPRGSNQGQEIDHVGNNSGSQQNTNQYRSYGDFNIDPCTNHSKPIDISGDDLPF